MKRIAVFLCLIVLLFSLSAIGGAVHATVTFAAPELLARPTDTSITINVAPSANGQVYFQYGTATGVYAGQTDTATLTSGTPTNVVISGLTPDTQYYYRMASSSDGSSWTYGTEHSFHTQRSPGSAFTFTIIADSHMNGGGGNVALYQQTLKNVLADHPDFHFDLGDTFWMDGVTSATVANQRYLNQRSWMGAISQSVPIFVSVGNHEQEEAWHLDDTGNPATSPPVLSANARKKYFPNPIPDNFYAGNNDPYSYLIGDHLREDYYAWTWGDALFVVIDPYWYTTTKPYIGNAGGGESSDVGSGHRWDWTLGLQQFNWFKQTLEQSNAKFKFVLDHHMVGGAEDYVRGGANYANLVEWGGYNVGGTTWGWDANRPVSQWGSEPIHQIMVDNHVTAYFHGHDHLFAYESRDGVVYQEVPSPSMPGTPNSGYYNGPHTIKVLPSPGHLRVTVSPSQVMVDYIATSSDTVNYTYTIAPNSGNNPPAANNPPVANNQSVTINEDTATAITLTATDADNDPLTYSIGAQPTHGSLSGTAPNLTYTPAYNYNGPDSFTFKANDGKANSNVATVTITVNPVNDAPVANNQSVNINENTATAITLTANDVDSSTLTYSIETSPTRGTLSGTAPNVTYTPNNNYIGGDSFTFKANDGQLDSNTATVSIMVTAVNNPSTTTLNPNASGAQTGLYRGAGTSNWNACTTSDGDTSYVRWGGSNWTYDLYNLADPVSPTGTINSVTVYFEAMAVPAPTQPSAQTVIRIGTTNYYGGTSTTIGVGTTLTLTTSYATYSNTYLTKPGGGSWGWADINSLQAGVALRQATSGVQDPSRASHCTHVWVVVNYTSG